MGPLFASLGVGFLWLAWLMAKERLPRNRLVGMRTRATAANDLAWNAAHRASAWSVAATGIVLLLSGLWLLFTGPAPGNSRFAVQGTTLVVLILVVVGGIQADRVAKRTTRSNQS